MTDAILRSGRTRDRLEWRIYQYYDVERNTDMTVFVVDQVRDGFVMHQVGASLRGKQPPFGKAVRLARLGCLAKMRGLIESSKLAPTNLLCRNLAT